MSRKMEYRSIPTELRASGTDESPKIHAVFAVFDAVYDMGWCSESIDAHAFDDTVNDDIRALSDHDTGKVLGRTTAKTLALGITPRGLEGDIDINPYDTDAMNQWHRTQRGDVNQCSFGFEILDEERTIRDGKDHFTIRKLKLYEVSIVAFPAYETTSAAARSAMRKRNLFADWKQDRERKIAKWEH